MDQPFGFIRQIQRSKRFMLKLRAIRIFEKSYDSIGLRQLEIVFHDEEGTRISGIIRGVHLSKMAGYFHECGVYKLRNYYLDSNIDKYRSTVAKYKLLIHSNTEVLEMHTYFPSWHFQFRSFADFQDVENVDESYLFDVIGMVIEICPVQSKWVHGQKNQMIVFSLMDLNGIVIQSTLWGHYVDQLIAFETHFESEATGEPWVLIMQLCQARFWEAEVQLATHMNVTRLHAVAPFPDLIDFQRKFSASPWAKKRKYVTNSKIVLKSEMEELENGDLVISSVDSLFDSDEEIKCWVCATIDSIVDEWWYLACRRCKGKMADEDGKLSCTKCAHQFGVTRYKIRLIVSDSTSSATFICWDRESEKMIGTPCEALISTFLHEVRVYPKHPSGQKASFPVVRVVADETLVSMYNQWFVENEGSDFLTVLQREDHDNGLDATLDDEVSTPLKFFQPIEKGDTSTAKRKLLNDLSTTPNVDQFVGSADAGKGKGKMEKLDPSALQDEDVAEN
ncbi:replication protein A 70 kDa DNA-binding subunit [Striga asiatica]|uniref:Replication protein A 70 kDa DNA-binding subunit n=1 Tax=Striga asiatica TaxID=4170 RepID=A0A5A7Q0Y9_STRAF|nr:replication protein A 70 kDa DNA-binding subunit [Striga asiatica]